MCVIDKKPKHSFPIIEKEEANMINKTKKMRCNPSQEKVLKELTQRWRNFCDGQEEFHFTNNKNKGEIYISSIDDQETKKKLSKRMYAKWGHISLPHILTKKRRVY